MAGDLTVRNIKVTDRIEPGSAGGTVTLGNSINADTIAVPSGVTLNINSGATFLATAGTMSGQNYPAFEASLSSAQSLSDDASTKVQFDTKLFDTDSAYDSSTNYRFTVPSGKAGKYYFYSMVSCYGDGTNQDVLDFQLAFFLNGSRDNYYYMTPEAVTPAWRYISITLSKVLDLSDGDYVEVYAQVNSDSGTANLWGTAAGATRNIFGAYRIGA